MRRSFAHRCRSLIKHPVYAKFFCPDCHKPDMDQFQRSVNFFLLYLLPQSFSIDKPLLAKRYRDYQRLLHPDKLLAHNIHCQDYSKFVSLAYTTLAQDVSRAHYLLQLHGRSHNVEATLQDEQFMEEMFDLRCELQACKEDREGLCKVLEKSETEKQAYLHEVSKAFEAGDLTKASELTTRLQFLQKIFDDAKDIGRDTN